MTKQERGKKIDEAVCGLLNTLNECGPEGSARHFAMSLVREVCQAIVENVLMEDDDERHKMEAGE